MPSSARLLTRHSAEALAKVEANAAMKTVPRRRRLRRCVGKKDIMKKPAGRPRKYHVLLRQLDPDTLYSAASIARWAIATDQYGTLTPNQQKMTQQRIRIALGRWCNNHQFPDEGDGIVLLPGQSPTPGWFGWRWQRE